MMMTMPCSLRQHPIIETETTYLQEKEVEATPETTEVAQLDVVKEEDIKSITDDNMKQELNNMNRRVTTQPIQQQ